VGEIGMNDCPRFGKLFNGCKFEARFDDGVPDQGKRGTIQGSDAECIAAFFHGIRSKTYVHDICIRCGKTVKRP
jgi:hypothetical protein